MREIFTPELYDSLSESQQKILYLVELLAVSESEQPDVVFESVLPVPFGKFLVTEVVEVQYVSNGNVVSPYHFSAELVDKDNDPLKGFAIRGPEADFVYRIKGKRKNCVPLGSDRKKQDVDLFFELNHIENIRVKRPTHPAA